MNPAGPFDQNGELDEHGRKLIILATRVLVACGYFDLAYRMAKHYEIKSCEIDKSSGSAPTGGPDGPVQPL